MVCTGLFDDNKETPDDYRDMLARMRERGLPMICANPTSWSSAETGASGAPARWPRAMRRSAARSLCGQALSRDLPERAGRGGDSRRARSGPGACSRSATACARIIGRGDAGFRMSVRGGGIHAAEVLDKRGEPDPERLAHVFAGAGAWPAAVIRRLVGKVELSPAQANSLSISVWVMVGFAAANRKSTSCWPLPWPLSAGR